MNQFWILDPSVSLRTGFGFSIGRSTRKKIFCVALGALLFTHNLPAEAQQAGKVYRIGYLSPRLRIDSRAEAFRQGLRELGYVEGQNIVIEWRFTKGKTVLFPELAAELVRLKMDCILAVGVSAIRALKQLTDTIPIVMGTIDADPVEQGLVASLARPGGNITGLTSISADLVGKQLELLKETVPTLTRVGVLWDAADPGGTRNFKVTEVTAQALGVQVQPLEVRSPEEFEATFKAATAARARAIIILQTNLTNTHRKRIVELAAKSRLATMLGESGLMDAGGLMSYGPNYADLFRRSATNVDKILKGTKPGDLPVERPTRFELIINLKTAKQIGLTIPPNVLARADKVIK